jgi:hypothetical protein
VVEYLPISAKSCVQTPVPQKEKKDPQTLLSNVYNTESCGSSMFNLISIMAIPIDTSTNSI